MLVWLVAQDKRCRHLVGISSKKKFPLKGTVSLNFWCRPVSWKKSNHFLWKPGPLFGKQGHLIEFLIPSCHKFWETKSQFWETESHLMKLGHIFWKPGHIFWTPGLIFGKPSHIFDRPKSETFFEFLVISGLKFLILSTWTFNIYRKIKSNI